MTFLSLCACVCVCVETMTLLSLLDWSVAAFFLLLGPLLPPGFLMVLRLAWMYMCRLAPVWIEVLLFFFCVCVFVVWLMIKEDLFLRAQAEWYVGSEVLQRTSAFSLACRLSL